MHPRVPRLLTFRNGFLFFGFLFIMGNLLMIEAVHMPQFDKNGVETPPIGMIFCGTWSLIFGFLGLTALTVAVIARRAQRRR